MSEHFDEQISEFIDDEMSAEECEFFVRRLQRDEPSRARYLRYQLIGAAVRGEHLRLEAAGFRQPAAGHPGAAGGAARTAGWFTSGRVAVGTGIAASVALVALVGLRLTGLGPELDADAPGGELARSEPPSYVVPPGTAEAGELFPLQGEVTGIQYLMHHTGYSSGLNRTIMHSNVVSGPQADEDEDENEAGEADSL